MVYSVMYWCLVFTSCVIIFVPPSSQLNSKGGIMSPTSNYSISSSLTYLKSSTSAPIVFLRSLCKHPRGRFPHPLDCKKYVDCWDGHVKEQQCPEGTVFSDLPGEFCDFLEYVDCGERVVAFNPESTSSSRPPCIRFNHHKPVAFIPRFELPEDLDANRIISSPFEPPSVPGLIKLDSGNFYLFVRSVEVNFTTARQICQRMGLDLVSILSQNDNEVLEQQISIVELDSPRDIHNSGRFWIGATYSTEKEKYIWIPTKQEIKFSNWLFGHPVRGEKCVHFIQEEITLGWKSEDCSKKLRFICQWYPPSRL